MAKTKRETKIKKDEISQDLQIRLLGLVLVFFVIITAMQQGFIGEGLHFVFLYIFGSFAGIIYLLMMIYGGYVTYYAKMPILKGPKIVGAIILMIGLFISASTPANETVIGLPIISQYMKTVPLNRGGIIGAVLNGLLSVLFGRLGTIIAAVILIAVGLFLICAKYFRSKKIHKKKAKQSIKIDNKPYTIKKKNRNLDFFSKPQKKKGILFPENVFEQDKEFVEKNKKTNKPSVKIHENGPKLDLNKETMQLEIIEPKQKEIITPEPKVQVVKPKEMTNYKLPSLSLLKGPQKTKGNDNRNVAIELATKLTTVLQEFGVNATVSDIFIGPTVTKYELKLQTGTRVNKILQLQDDIKLALAAKDIRIEAPIPGKSAVGVEIPNLSTTAVNFKEGFDDIPRDIQSNRLVVPLGKDVSGKTIFAQLNKMPHLLIAGATGSGKSVCINTIICSILMRAKPEEVRLILVDPKKVELSSYNGVPHLLTPVVTDPKKAAKVLREVVSEMERRYELFAKHNVRNIEGYNSYAKNFNQSASDDEKVEIFSYHVVILDEVADLMMVASKDVEDCIMRIAQMARAAGIHLIVATQRPSTDVITGVIKANIPSRIAFAVSSSIDSRTILDCTGAEKLLGRGDMLFSPMGSTSPVRVQGAFVSDEEVEAIVYHTKSQQEVSYDDHFVNITNTSESSEEREDVDEEYEMCRSFVINAQKASTSLLQRQFRIGYNKAARIIDQLEIDGIIGPQIGAKPREILVRGYDEE